MTPARPTVAPAPPPPSPAELPLPGPFISYSRRDLPFVRKLSEALRARGREAWVDLEGIEPSQAWLETLHAAIDAASAFVFVLSPESVRSRYCHEEVQRAEEGKKKLIPVLHRAVEPAEVPPALARLQWISCTTEAEFDARVDDLIGALDTDLEWTERHTRLLVRAREWVAAERDRGHLLRGGALEEAERWLLDSAAWGERRPSPLHTEYIGASTLAAKRGRNRLLAGVSGAALVALTLSIVALQQRNEARENARQALSRQLAAQAQATMEADLGLAALLAVTGYRTRPTFEASQAVARAMRLRPHLAAFYSGHTGRVQHLAFADGVEWLASSAEDGRVIVWDRATHGVLFDSTFADATAAAGGGGADAAPAVAISGAAGVVAVAAGGGAVVLRPLREGATAATLSTRGRVRALAFDPAGGLLAVGNDSSTVSILEWASGRARCSFGTPRAASVTALRFDARGARLASIDYAGSVRVVDAGGCAPAAAEVEGIGGSFAALSPDLGLAAATDAGIPEVALADLRSGAVLRRGPPGTTDFLLAVAIGPGVDGIAVGTAGGEVLRFHPGLERPLPPLLGHRADVTSLAYDEGGAMLASGSIEGEVIVWDLGRSAPLEPVRELAAPGAAMVAFEGAGTGLLATDEEGEVLRWAAGAEASAPGLPGWGRASLVAVDARAERVALLRGDTVTVRGVRDGAVLARIPRRGTDQTYLALDASGTALAFVEEGRAVIVDLGRDTTLVAGGRDDAHGALTFDAAGDVLAYTAGDDAVFFDRRSGRTRAVRVSDAKGPVQSLALSPDGALLATGGNLYDGTVRLREAATGTQRRALPTGNQMLVARVFFSPDGRTVGAVTAFEEALYLWDVESGQPTLGPVRLAADPQRAPVAAFSPDGVWLATVERSGIVLRDLRPASWIASLCHAIDRELTPEEWRGYGVEDRDPGCPSG